MRTGILRVFSGFRDKIPVRFERVFEAALERNAKNVKKCERVFCVYFFWLEMLPGDFRGFQLRAGDFWVILGHGMDFPVVGEGFQLHGRGFQLNTGQNTSSAQIPAKIPVRLEIPAKIPAKCRNTG